jgi:uncharacterized protein (DUF2225 family)
MYLTDVGVKCPNCGVKFNSRQLALLIDTGRRNSELRQDFEGTAEQFEPYAICTCPSCGRADWMTGFEPVNESVVLSQPTTTPHLQFRAAALAVEKSGRDLYKAGMFYLYAAWCADDTQAYPQAREYRRFAAEAFRRSLVDVSCPVDQRVEIEYLIGELLRRSGDFEASRQHFRQAIPRLPGKYAYMARKLTRLAEAGSIESIRFENEGI